MRAERVNYEREKQTVTPLERIARHHASCSRSWRSSCGSSSPRRRRSRRGRRRTDIPSRVPRPRDVFADVGDELRRRPRRGAPPADVFYVGDPPRAIVQAELPGRRPGRGDGRGPRARAAARRAGASRRGPRGGSTSRSRCAHGAFRRVIQLGADVVAEEATADLPRRHPRDHAAARARGEAPPARSRSPSGTAARERRPARAAASRPSPARVLPLREAVGFPETVMPLAIGQPRSIELVNDALTHDRLIVMVASRDPELEEPPPADLYEVGVVGVIARMMRAPDGTQRILVQCAQRVRITRWVREQPYLVAEVEDAPDVVVEPVDRADRARAQRPGDVRADRRGAALPARGAPGRRREHRRPGAALALHRRLAAAEDRGAPGAARGARRRPAAAADRRDPRAGARGRPDRVADPVAGPGRDRGPAARVLPAPAAQGDPGGAGGARPGRGRGRRAARAARRRSSCPRRSASRSTASSTRLERLPQAAAEHGVVRGWLEWIASLPWDEATEDNLDLAHAREVLDEDHFGLEKVKDRILEFLAVRRLKPDARGSILLFAGPPGVGKTSLGRSIARALGREFERISVGGVRDEAEIRGHRRTYIGAMPGVIIRAMRDAGSRNPLFMIDEIDKMGSDFRGDPASAMLEVLDPEQNDTFRDHYLDVPFSLSCGDVRRDGEHARHDPAAAARPDGGHPARGLHRGGEAPDRQALPRAAAGRAQRAEEVADRDLRPRAARRHLRLHARGGRPAARARDRLDLPQGRAPGRGGDGEEARQRRRAARARAARPAALLRRGAAAHARARRRDRAWRGRRSAATSSSSRRRRCRAAAS